MENNKDFDMDKLLCNLTYEEYIVRKEILELKLKINNLENPDILKTIVNKINELRERSNHLNEIKLQYICNQNAEKTR